MDIPNKIAAQAAQESLQGRLHYLEEIIKGLPTLVKEVPDIEMQGFLVKEIDSLGLIVSVMRHTVDSYILRSN